MKHRSCNLLILSKIMYYIYLKKPPFHQILCLDCSISTISWLSPPTVVVGLCNAQESLRVYNVNSGKMVPVAGISGTDCGGGRDVTCLAVNMFG